MVIRKEPTHQTLEHIYNTIHKIISKPQCYYTEEELKKLKENKNNVFLKNGNEENQWKI